MLKTDYLKKYFGYDSFRPGQDEIVDSLLAGNDTLAVLPTGGGKSICYQIPAIMMEGTAIVISPLISLMKDQIDALSQKGIPAAFINSTLSYEEILSRLDEAAEGNYKLIYLAPERLDTKFFKGFLERVKLSFIAIDEAHCVSEWGHDFRPSYLNIASSLHGHRAVPKIALTATATEKVRTDIVKYLEMQQVSSFVRGFDRPNLRWIVESPPDKLKAAAHIIHRTKFGSTIIYCASRKRVEDTAFSLRGMGIAAEHYHAGMKAHLRRAVQERFITGATPVIVATNAFGMGIDKPDVRNIIHMELCSTLEAYVQEAGRGGRDGEPANCYLFYQHDDRDLQDFFIDLSHPRREDFLSVLDFIKKQQHEGVVKFDDLQIANFLMLNEGVVRNIVNFFEKEEVLQRVPAAGKVIVTYRSHLEDFRQYYRLTTPERRPTLEALIRYSHSVRPAAEFRFDLKTFLRKYQLTEAAALDLLEALQIYGLIDYSYFDKPAIRLLMPTYKLDYTKIRFLKKMAREKLDKVIDYAETHRCKREYILNYFGERTTSFCGNCTSCE